MYDLEAVGETTITGKNQISLPIRGVRKLGWQKGDQLRVEVIDDTMMILVRRPTNWTEAYAGKLGHIFGDHDDTIRYLEQERASWDDDPDDSSRT